GTTSDLGFTVETVRCIGCCGLAPVARVDNKNIHSHLTQAKVPAVLKKYQPKPESTVPVQTDEADHAKA
ncbi:MAG TPA: NAD(P)H-dependent oxidoreductase subunit E, partial [Terriglobales bacterium]|nr:NAD(P)H-dependent oxidoreductase subunit E [Terriglobales bacterium]